MSEQKETKNMKNAAEAQVPEQNTTETAAKQNDDAKQADTTEQQADAAAFQVVNEGFSTREAIEEAKRCLHCKIPQCKKGCPIGNDIPDFVHELSMGNMGAAMSIINAKSNLPAICAVYALMRNSVRATACSERKENRYRSANWSSLLPILIPR